MVMVDLPNFFSLAQKVGESFPEELTVVLLTAIAMLVAHALLILLIGKIYQVLIDWADNRNIFWLSIPFYMIAVGLVFMTHLVDIVVWSYALIALKVFEIDTNAFYFAGEMYTTVGYGTFPLPENWKILPIVVAFSGIFAASMSGAVLFNMIGQIIRKKTIK
ncbi:MAG: hypothetical protein RLZZ365_181 [Pseudomonadota bacterium]|jgi:hypothetical protein